VAAAQLARDAPQPRMDATRFERLSLTNMAALRGEVWPKKPDVELNVVLPAHIAALDQTDVDDGKSAGPDGFTGHHLWRVIEDKRNHIVMAKIIMAIQNGHLNGDLVKDKFVASRLVAINKGTTDKIRPICVPQALTKLASAMLVKDLAKKQESQDPIFPCIQFGIFAKGGTQSAIHTLQATWSYLRKCNRPVALLGFDCANGFCSMSVPAMAQALVDAELWSLVNLFWTQYGTPASMCVYESTRLVGHLSCVRGCRQGDPIACLCFCLAMQPVYELVLRLLTLDNIKRALGIITPHNEDSKTLTSYQIQHLHEIIPELELDTVGMAVIDDYHLVGHPAVLEVAEIIMERNLPEGISFNKEKFTFLLPNPDHVTNRIRKQLADNKRNVEFGATRVYGGYVGDEDAIARLVEQDMDKDTRVNKFATRLPKLAVSSQTKFQIVRSCLSSIKGYQCRVVPPSAFSPAARNFDAQIHGIIAKLAKITEPELGKDPGIVERIAQPLSLGGGGIRSAEDVSHCAYLASTLTTLAFNNAMQQPLTPNMSQIIAGTEMERSMQLAWAVVQEQASIVPGMLSIFYENMGLLNARKAYQDKPTAGGGESEEDKAARSPAERFVPLQTLISVITAQSPLKVLEYAAGRAVASTPKSRNVSLMDLALKDVPQSPPTIDLLPPPLQKDQKEPTMIALLSRLRLQKLFTRSRENAIHVDLLKRLKVAWLESEERLKSANAAGSQSTTPQKQEALRSTHATMNRLVALLCKCDPDAAIALRTLPVPDDDLTSLASSAFETMYRVWLGLKPYAWCNSCTAAHYGPLYEGMQSGHHDLDVQHWSTCPGALRLHYMSTERHDLVARTVRTLAQRRACSTIFEPAVEHITTLGPAHTKDHSKIGVAPPRAVLGSRKPPVIPHASADEDTLDGVDSDEMDIDLVQQRRKGDAVFGDLGIAGAHIEKYQFIDFAISGPTMPSKHDWWKARLKEYAREGVQRKLPVWAWTEMAEKIKLRKYENAIRSMLPSGSLVSQDNPMQAYHATFVPAVLTTFGNMGLKFKKLIGVLAKQGALEFFSNSSPHPPSQDLLESSENKHKQYLKSVIAIACMQGTSNTFIPFLNT
jgi:hypothetical protein